MIIRMVMDGAARRRRRVVHQVSERVAERDTVARERRRGSAQYGVHVLGGNQARAAAGVHHGTDHG